MVNSSDDAGNSRVKEPVQTSVWLYVDLFMLLVVALGTGSIANAGIPMYLSRHADVPRSIAWIDVLPGPAWVGVAVALAALLAIKRTSIRSHRIDRAIDMATLGVLIMYAGFLAYAYHVLEAGILHP
jgi:uncharacterized membrane protein